MTQQNIACFFWLACVALGPLKAVQVEIHTPKEGFVLGGPMAVEFSLKNNQSSNVTIRDVEFDMDRVHSHWHAGLIIFPFLPTMGGGLQLVGPTGPGQSLTKSYYLNRYISITAPGTYKLKAEIGAMVDDSSISKYVEFTIRIVSPTDEAMSKKIDKLAAQIPRQATSQDFEKIEELMFFRNPQAVRAAGRIYSGSSFEVQQSMVQITGLNRDSGLNYLQEFSKYANGPAQQKYIAQETFIVRRFGR